MPKVCEVTGKKPLVGNNVSHAKNRNKTRYLPNLQSTSFWSDLLGKRINVRSTAKGIRTVEKNHGIDNWLTSMPNRKQKIISSHLRSVRETILRAKENSNSKA